MHRVATISGKNLPTIPLVDLTLRQDGTVLLGDHIRLLHLQDRHSCHVEHVLVAN